MKANKATEVENTLSHCVLIWGYFERPKSYLMNLTCWWPFPGTLIHLAIKYPSKAKQVSFWDGHKNYEVIPSTKLNESSFIHYMQCVKYYSPKLSKPIISSTQPDKNVNNTMYCIPRPWVNSYDSSDMIAVGPIETSLIVPNTTYK